MACDRYIELMSAALDGACTADERNELDSHLAVCPECAELFGILSTNANAMRELDCEMPADLKSRIMSSLPAQEQPAKQGKVIHWKRWAPVAAAACLVLVISLVPGLFRAGSTENSAPAAPGAAPVPSSAPAMLDPRDGNVNGIADSADGIQYSATGSEPSEVPSEPEAAEPNQYQLENQQAIRVSYDEDSNTPSAIVLASADSLTDYLRTLPSHSFDEVSTLTEAYTEDYFAHHSLLLVWVTEGSGSIRHEIQSLTGSTVTVRRIVPEAGTCDMAAWLLVAEVPSMFDDGFTPEVDFTN